MYKRQTYEITKEPIKRQQQLAKEEASRLVFEEAESFQMAEEETAGQVNVAIEQEGYTCLLYTSPLLLPEEKVGGSFPKGGAEGGSVKVRELGQKDSVFFLVAVKSPGLTAVCFVHIGSHTLMDSLVFFREIVIILSLIHIWYALQSDQSVKRAACR